MALKKVKQGNKYRMVNDRVIDGGRIRGENLKNLIESKIEIQSSLRARGFNDVAEAIEKYMDTVENILLGDPDKRPKLQTGGEKVVKPLIGI